MFLFSFFAGGRLIAAFLYGNPLFRVGVQQLSKKAQLPSLAVPPECYSSSRSAPNRKYPRVVLGKEEGKKRGVSNLAAMRNDGAGERKTEDLGKGFRQGKD